MTFTGDICTSVAISLQPTQALLGGLEVQCKIEHLNSLPPSEQVHFLSKNPVPGVIGPGGIIAITDHHHLVSAVNSVIPTVPMYISVSDNLANLSALQFWQAMAARNLLWLVDERSRAPINPLLLPTSVERMVEYPLRSLSWMVRSNGGYGKTEDAYQDFFWAKFFNQYQILPRLPSSANESDFPWSWCTAAPYSDGCSGNLTQMLYDALPAALTLAKSPAAAGLPGYGQGVIDYPDCGNTSGAFMLH